MQCQNVPRPHLPRVGRSRTIIGHSELASRGPKPLRAGGDAIAPRPARSLQPVPRPRRTLYLFGAREALQTDSAKEAPSRMFQLPLNRRKAGNQSADSGPAMTLKCHSRSVKYSVLDSKTLHNLDAASGPRRPRKTRAHACTRKLETGPHEHSFDTQSDTHFDLVPTGQRPSTRPFENEND